MNFLLNIIFFINLSFLKVNCELSSFSSSKFGSKTPIEDKDSKEGKNKHNVKISFIRRRSSVRRKGSRKSVKGGRQHINDISDSNHLSGPMISKELYAGKKCVNYIVWHKVWCKCDYKCFADDHFLELKYRLIEELNRYREIHKMQPLLKDITLYKKAQKHAKNLAITRSLRRDNDIRTGLLMGIVYYSAASVMVKK
uniref:Exported protein n=1 Tax=Strongyloides papillosus TaxID=174720 RepID=A0A0N5CGB9_STREA